jgi:hypothetical protein
MTTRTELIARLRVGYTIHQNDTPYLDGADELMDLAADILEADELLRLANLDCVNHFDAIKEDYDKLRAAATLAQDALNSAAATCLDARSHQEFMSSPSHFMRQAIAALKDALK